MDSLHAVIPTHPALARTWETQAARPTSRLFQPAYAKRRPGTMSNAIVDALKPHVEKLVAWASGQIWPLVVALLIVLAAWFYADLYLDAPLNRYEVVGFFVLGFLSIIAIRYAYGWARKLISTLSLVCAFLVFSDPVSATDLRIIQIPETGRVTYDLRPLSLFQFPFPLNELHPLDAQEKPEEQTDCLEFHRATGPDNNRTIDKEFHVTFCGYGDLFRDGTGSMIVGTDGQRAYAFELYDMRRGGGGSIGFTLEIPSTRLVDYLETEQVELEFLTRSFLTSDHAAFADRYIGYGMYGFILFRDRGTLGADKKEAISKAFLSILPEFVSTSFGVRPANLGVLIYPTTISSASLYSAINVDQLLDDEQNEIGVLDGKSLTAGYDYSYATDALRRLGDEAKLDVPEISLVFLSAASQTDAATFGLSNFNWERALVYDISTVGNYEKLFLDLNNYFVHGIKTKDVGVFARLRKFAESTGRLSLLFFDGGS